MTQCMAEDKVWDGMTVNEHAKGTASNAVMHAANSNNEQHLLSASLPTVNSQVDLQQTAANKIGCKTYLRHCWPSA